MWHSLDSPKSDVVFMFVPILCNSRSPFRYLLSPCPSLSSLHTHFSQHLHWSALEPRGNTSSAGAGEHDLRGSMIMCEIVHRRREGLGIV